MPERVAIARPSSGVNPMVVSTERPAFTAASEAPAPRWQVTMRRPVRWPSEQLGRSSRRVGVGEAVEAEAAQAPLLSPGARAARRCAAPARDRGVKGGVKARDRGAVGPQRR